MGAFVAVVLGALLPLCVDGGTNQPQQQMKIAFVGPAGRAIIRSGARATTCGLHQDDVVKANGKGAFYIPATSQLSWREYRSRLCKAETPYYMRRASLHTSIWAHEIPALERGCVLITKPKKRVRKGGEEGTVGNDQLVVLLLQHDPIHGSYGLILNKPTPCGIGDFTDKLPAFAESAIHFGGEGHHQLQGQEVNRELHAIHTCPWVANAEEVIEGVYLGADLRHADRLVSLGKVRARDFKFFYSATIWQPGELEAEMTSGRWLAAACHKDLISNASSAWEKPLWRTLLDLIGGKVALMGRELAGEL